MMLIGNMLPTFWRNLLLTSSGVKHWEVGQNEDMKMEGGPTEEGPCYAPPSCSSFGSPSISSCTCTSVSSFFRAPHCFIWFLLLDCPLSLSYLFFLPLHYFVTLRMEAVSFSKVMNYHSTQCYIPDNCNSEMDTDVNICLKLNIYWK
jgi:hypothetical protein